jgi:hypothetical protein
MWKKYIKKYICDYLKLKLKKNGNYSKIWKK